MSAASTVLVDTTVASFLHPRRRGTEVGARYDVHMENRILALSFQSVAELWHWAESRDWVIERGRSWTPFSAASRLFPRTMSWRGYGLVS